jgi:hypothetical protein
MSSRPADRSKFSFHFFFSFHVQNFCFLSHGTSDSLGTVQGSKAASEEASKSK